MCKRTLWRLPDLAKKASVALRRGGLFLACAGLRLRERHIGHAAQVNLVQVALLAALTDNLDVIQACRAVEGTKHYVDARTRLQDVTAHDVIAPGVGIRGLDVHVGENEGRVVVHGEVPRI